MIYAVDCDLRKVYCVSEKGEVIAKAHPNASFVLGLGPTSTVLFEIASPLDYTPEGTQGAKAIAHNKRRWTIWNVATAASIYEVVRPWGSPRLLVSPSHEWTRRFDLKTRHAMAGCKQKQKDLRECEAMIWFYQRYPEAWVPFDDFLANL